MQQTESTTLILNHEQVMQKLRRLAYEIYENNVQAEELLLAGIEKQGFVIAEMLKALLEEISPLRITLISVVLDKKTVKKSKVQLSCDKEALSQKTIILVDDVLSTGSTLAFSLKPFLKASIAKLEIAVLINRAHLKFPIHATYTGLELATTLQNHIAVEQKEGQVSVLLH